LKEYVMTITTRELFILGLAAVQLFLGGAIVSAAPDASPLARSETTRLVRLALERLPNYGVFDLLTFGVDRGAVTLQGFAYQDSLVLAAAAAVKHVAGVDDVAVRVETLPVSREDDRIRRDTFYRIYTDRFLSRYAPGGEPGARFAAHQFARFPGTQPSGRYPIHIIVRNGRTTLVGGVDSVSDKRLAEVRAREVSGTFAVHNELVVNGAGKESVTLRAPSRSTAPDAGVRIIWPLNGYVFHPGETVPVEVVSTTIHDAELAIVSPFGISDYARSLPARLSVVIPGDAGRGTYSIAAFGITGSNLPVHSGSVVIRVEPSPVRCEDFD
jgi:hypothetical protein